MWTYSKEDLFPWPTSNTLSIEKEQRIVHKKQLHQCYCLNQSSAQQQVKAIFPVKPLEYRDSNSNCSLTKEHYLLQNATFILVG